MNLPEFQWNLILFFKFQIGFFKRKYKPIPQEEQNGRESWSFVNGNQKDTSDNDN